MPNVQRNVRDRAQPRRLDEVKTGVRRRSRPRKFWISARRCRICMKKKISVEAAPMDAGESVSTI